MIFGKDRKKGIRLNGTRPEVVELGKGVSEDDLLFHDEKAADPAMAFMLARMRKPEFPEPVGIFRAIQRATYDEMVNKQMEDAIAKQGEGDLDELFNSGETWVVE
jgi:2-oxoglutarate ferredoxin oxidoreductase subunit beta